ncbi:Gfo/Idh/MocA family protein [Opitutus terrae]|uniref:Oxidoreductase domain protein n=1 Tax=Opitutus terrae (strain DSM 11246 / JCM 15787 / PB90-1) TaxID=452637 RepID=B2A0A9_OPITP|nr:Gfo/Idh/MocA family oxidoreductase [Opitutus terrae]ACB77445.1 oxidoreductase domain protein [Opitutus terrae PB90-1]
MNRRSFLSSLALATTAAAIAPTRLFATTPSTRPRLGLIGCGWFGGLDLESFLQLGAAEVVSLCDPNAHALANTLQLVARYQATAPRTFADYRGMLASGDHDIVIVATPDHWHALPAIDAMRAGADVYLEKPVGVDVMEGEALVAAARQYRRVVQVNTQRRSNPHFAVARDRFIRSGRLGAIGLVEGYCYLPNRPAEPMPPVEPPAHLDFNLWSGPAPVRPFVAAVESRGWRNFTEYGNGVIGDMGVHVIDFVRWMLGLGWPELIHSTGGIYVHRDASANISDTQRSVFRYRHLDVSWEHRTWGGSRIPSRHWTDQWGASFIGEHGTLHTTLFGYEFVPADGSPREGFHLLSRTGDLENIDFEPWMDRFLGIQALHVADFLKCRETRQRPAGDIEEGHISSACCALANIAQDLGRPLQYDPKNRSVPGDAEATRRLARSYRAPWVHPVLTHV